MRLMHTKLPDFIKKVKQAATKSRPEMTLEITGIENIKTAKAQSLRTGRIESAIEELAQAEGVEGIQLILRPRLPEVMYTVVIKGVDRDGKGKAAIVETIDFLVPTEDEDFFDCETVIDRRPMMSVYNKL